MLSVASSKLSQRSDRGGIGGMIGNMWNYQKLWRDVAKGRQGLRNALDWNPYGTKQRSLQDARQGVESICVQCSNHLTDGFVIDQAGTGPKRVVGSKYCLKDATSFGLITSPNCGICSVNLVGGGITDATGISGKANVAICMTCAKSKGIKIPI